MELDRCFTGLGGKIMKMKERERQRDKKTRVLAQHKIKNLFFVTVQGQ